MTRMTHATFWSIQILLGIEDPKIIASGFSACTKACDWSENVEWDDATFSAVHGMVLLRETRVKAYEHHWPVTLPTCPKCAVFIDMALELRGK